MTNVVLLVITDGRKEYLTQTLESASKNLVYDFAHKIIMNDSGDQHYAEFLVQTYPDFFIISHSKRSGLTAAINTAWAALPSDTDYIFHLEEDFTFNKQINILEMINILEANSYLVELTLKRQPVNRAEEEAGGFMQQNPTVYVDREAWVEQDAYFTLNPSLYSINLTKDGWPLQGDEGKFFNQIKYPNGVLNADLRCAFLGHFNDPPLVHHIGSKRSDEWVL